MLNSLIAHTLFDDPLRQSADAAMKTIAQESALRNLVARFPAVLADT